MRSVCNSIEGYAMLLTQNAMLIEIHLAWSHPWAQNGPKNESCLVSIMCQLWKNSCVAWKVPYRSRCGYQKTVPQNKYPVKSYLPPPKRASITSKLSSSGIFSNLEPNQCLFQSSLCKPLPTSPRTPLQKIAGNVQCSALPNFWKSRKMLFVSLFVHKENLTRGYSPATRHFPCWDGRASQKMSHMCCHPTIVVHLRTTRPWACGRAYKNEARMHALYGALVPREGRVPSWGPRDLYASRSFEEGSLLLCPFQKIKNIPHKGG